MLADDVAPVQDHPVQDHAPESFRDVADALMAVGWTFRVSKALAPALACPQVTSFGLDARGRVTEVLTTHGGVRPGDDAHTWAVWPTLEPVMRALELEGGDSTVIRHRNGVHDDGIERVTVVAKVKSRTGRVRGWSILSTRVDP